MSSDAMGMRIGGSSGSSGGSSGGFGSGGGGGGSGYNDNWESSSNRYDNKERNYNQSKISDADFRGRTYEDDYTFDGDKENSDNESPTGPPTSSAK